MGGRHAYMIMAHHKFSILKELLKDLDDERNDLFLHVDKKARDFDPEDICASIKKARICITERMDVRWGGFSQIQCILMLLERATGAGNHAYYHFMVGVEFPLKTQDYIHRFFDEHQGYEFIGFDHEDQKYMDRVRYYHIFNEYARNNTFFQKILNKINFGCVYIQKMLHVDLTKRYGIAFKKGNANWSMTHDLARYILSKKEEISRIYRHSFCGDEVFIHTIVFNSVFYKKVYDVKDEYRSSMRVMTWEDEKNQYHLKDLNYLMGCKRLFARKIDGGDALRLIDGIKRSRE